MPLIPVAHFGVQVGIGEHRGRGEDHDELAQRRAVVVVRVVLQDVVSRVRQDLAEPRLGTAALRLAGGKRPASRRVRGLAGQLRKALAGIAEGRRQSLPLVARQTFHNHGYMVPAVLAEIAIDLVWSIAAERDRVRAADCPEQSRPGRQVGYRLLRRLKIGRPRTTWADDVAQVPQPKAQTASTIAAAILARTKITMVSVARTRFPENRLERL